MSRTIRDTFLRWSAGVILGLIAVSWAQAAALKSVNVSRGSNDSQVVKITLDTPLAGEPVHFSTTNPHRIVLDLADTRGARLSETVDQGVIRSYDVIQAGERTRVVLNLTGPAAYQVRQVGNQLLVVVRGERGTPDAPPPTRFAEVGPKREHAVKDVEFKRAPGGEGRVIVHLSDPGVGVDIRSRGGSIQVDFLNTALPNPLQRRLDVSDFGTPAQLVETVEQGKNTRMKVDARGNWDYSAYQTGNQFVLEIRSLDDPRLRTLADKPRYTGEKLTLNFQNVEIRAVLQVIADFTGLNIIASDTVSGNITLRLKDVPWDQALDIILRAKGLDKRVTGNVIWVAPRDELAAKEKLELEAKQQIADLEPLVTESIPLNYLRANEAEGILMGKSIAALQAGQAVSCEASATGVGGQTQTAAAATGQAAQRVLSKRGSVTYDLKTNTLFVQDTAAKLEEVRNVLAKVDVPTRQVMIEARVVVADDGFKRNLGARLIGRVLSGKLGNYNTAIGSSTNHNLEMLRGTPGTGLLSGTPGTGLPPFNIDLPAGGLGGSPPGQIAITLLDKSVTHLLGLELQALEADARGKVISNPRVVTSNQKPAVILQGEEIPYVTVTNNTTTTHFRNAVLCLLVDPQILNNDNIILDVEVTKDARGESAGETRGFAINKKRVKTQVRVADGETAVLGGIYEQTIRNDTTKIPFLGDIPILGNLFKSNTKVDSKTELLIFLTPRILPDGFAAARLQ
jgi:type IV pilus assembly protein PilQ